MKKLLSLMLVITITLVALSMTAIAKEEVVKFPTPTVGTVSIKEYYYGCDLDWANSPEEQRIRYYNVYYLKVADDDRVIKADVLLEKGTVKQTSLIGFSLHPQTAGEEGKYAFVVTAVNWHGEESKPSNVVAAHAKTIHYTY